VTAPGDEQHRARSSSVFRFAIRGRRVERRGPPRRSSSSAFLRRVASANCPRRSTRQLHVVDDRGPTRLSMNSSSASRMRRRASSTMRPMCGSRVHRARWRPTSPTRLARKPRDKTSRLPTSSGSVIIGPRFSDGLENLHRRTTRAISAPRNLNAFLRVCPKSVGSDRDIRRVVGRI
jgi:hypothetical protein